MSEGIRDGISDTDGIEDGSIEREGILEMDGRSDGAAETEGLDEGAALIELGEAEIDGLCVGEILGTKVGNRV